MLRDNFETPNMHIIGRKHAFWRIVPIGQKMRSERVATKRKKEEKLECIAT